MSFWVLYVCGGFGCAVGVRILVVLGDCCCLD